MSSLLARAADGIGNAIKSAATLVPDRVTGFSTYGNQGAYGGASYGYGYGYGADYVDGAGRRAFGATGIIDESGVVATCAGVIADSFIQAPIALERLVPNKALSEGEPTHLWKRVDSHPLLDLLNRPNNHFGGDALWKATVRSEVKRGDGFWRVVMTRDRTQPAELWWERDMFPERLNAFDYVTRYRLMRDGKPVYLHPAANGLVRERTEYAIHFKYETNEHNDLRGYTPATTVGREIWGDILASEWQTGLFENGAGLGLLVSPTDTIDAAGQLDIEKFEAFTNWLKSKLRGRGAGGMAVSTQPLKVDKVNWSPEEMALDLTVSRFEARMCSAFGVDPMLIGLTGTQRTFSNFKEAENQFQTHKIAPLQERHGSDLEAQLFPLYGMSRAEWRIVWDRSHVAAFQEDVNEKHARVRADYTAGISDLEETTAALGYKSLPAMGGVRYKGMASVAPGEIAK